MRIIKMKVCTTLAAVMVSIGIGFILSGMLTSSVIKGCKTLNMNLPKLLGRIKLNEKSETEKIVCVEQGLFTLRIALPKGTLYLSTPLEGQAVTVRVVAGLLLLGCVGSVISTVFFTLSACFADNTNEKAVFITMKRNLIASMLQLLNVMLLVSGISIYTNQKIKSVGNAEEFTHQIHLGLSKMEAIFNPKSQILSPFLQAPQPVLEKYRNPVAQAFVAENARKNFLKNFLNISTENNQHDKTINNKRNENSLLSLSYVNLNQTLHSYNVTSVLSKSFAKRRRRNVQFRGPLRLRMRPRGPANVRNNLLDKFDNGHPAISYSFYFLWIGCIFHSLALIAGISNCKHSLSNQNLLPNFS